MYAIRSYYARAAACQAEFQGHLVLPKAPEVGERTKITVRLGLVDAVGKTVNDTSLEIEVV